MAGEQETHTTLRDTGWFPLQQEAQTIGANSASDEFSSTAAWTNDPRSFREETCKAVVGRRGPLKHRETSFFSHYLPVHAGYGSPLGKESFRTIQDHTERARLQTTRRVRPRFEGTGAG